MADRFTQRRRKLASAIRGTCDAILVTDVTNVSYLTGFTGDSSYLLLSKSETILLTDSRYDVQIEDECPGLEFVSRDSGTSMLDVITKMLGKLKPKTVGFEAHHVSVSMLEQLESSVAELKAGPEWIATTGKVETLRMVKDKVETEETRKAIGIAERAMRTIRQLITPEMTELQVAHELEHTMRRFGGECAAFDPIVAVGAWAALPHARPGTRRIEDDPLLLIDWGAETTSRYRSDQTRVLFPGKPSKRHEKIYKIVEKAYLAGVAAIEPGVKASDVDKAARDVIVKSGYGKNFGHGLGHGFGLQIHEDPRMSRMCDTVLEPGMMVTVEPGIYVAGWAGFRIEDDILVTKDGHENMCSLPTDFEWAQLSR